jgi:hypothetical protein
MGDTKAAPGATYEITIDGVPRSYRDDPRIAADAANFLKIKNPKSDVRVRDLRTNVVTSAQGMLPPDVSRMRNGQH